MRGTAGYAGETMPSTHGRRFCRVYRPRARPSTVFDGQIDGKIPWRCPGDVSLDYFTRRCSATNAGTAVFGGGNTATAGAPQLPTRKRGPAGELTPPPRSCGPGRCTAGSAGTRSDTLFSLAGGLSQKRPPELLGSLVLRGDLLALEGIAHHHLDLSSAL